MPQVPASGSALGVKKREKKRTNPKHPPKPVAIKNDGLTKNLSRRGKFTYKQHYRCRRRGLPLPAPGAARWGWQVKSLSRGLRSWFGHGAQSPHRARTAPHPNGARAARRDLAGAAVRQPACHPSRSPGLPGVAPAQPAPPGAEPPPPRPPAPLPLPTGPAAALPQRLSPAGSRDGMREGVGPGCGERAGLGCGERAGPGWEAGAGPGCGAGSRTGMRGESRTRMQGESWTGMRSRSRCPDLPGAGRSRRRSGAERERLRSGTSPPFSSFSPLLPSSPSPLGSPLLSFPARPSLPTPRCHRRPMQGGQWGPRPGHPVSVPGLGRVRVSLVPSPRFQRGFSTAEPAAQGAILRFLRKGLERGKSKRYLLDSFTVLQLLLNNRCICIRRRKHPKGRTVFKNIIKGTCHSCPPYTYRQHLSSFMTITSNGSSELDLPNSHKYYKIFQK